MARQPYMGLVLLVSSRFHDHTHLRHTTVGRSPLDEGPARRRDLYLTTHNTHKRQTSMPLVGFEPTILVSERPQTHVLDRTATGIGKSIDLHPWNVYSTHSKSVVYIFNYKQWTQPWLFHCWCVARSGVIFCPVRRRAFVGYSHPTCLLQSTSDWQIL
jgi:hypothetical protein